MLQVLVSPSHSAFVADRIISDNILIAHEAVHSLRTHSVVLKDFVAIITDMSKAFDMVEWNYLRLLMLAIGFYAKWIEWIMVCVTRVTYSVLINDQSFCVIEPSKGIRQGGPLSPFLFVLCSEGLSFMLNMVGASGQITGMRFSSQGHAIHHILFADDSKGAFLTEAQMLLSINVLKNQMWKLQISPKIKKFMWKALSDAVRVVDMLNCVGLCMDSRC